MKIQFRRSVKIFPGVCLHLSRGGIGISIGPQGAHVGRSADGRFYASLGIPGTGIYARQDFKKQLLRK